MLQTRYNPNSKLFWDDSEEGSDCKRKKKNQVSNVLQGRAGVYKPKAVLKGGFLEFDGEYLAQAAKSVSSNNVMLASVEQEQRLYFHLFHGTLIQM